MDFFFLVDILINFNLCYYDDERKRYVQSRVQVAIRCAPARVVRAAARAHARVARVAATYAPISCLTW